MKKRMLILLCALALLLSGCSMLNREYSSSAPHVEYQVSDKSTVLQAENYQGLVNAVLYFITEHSETGIVHLTYTEDGQVEDDLDAACREVCTEDPLGAYAVEDIQYSFQRITSYHEVTVSITYAHTEEEVAAIVPVVGSSAIRQTVSNALSSFADKCVFRVSYFTGDTASLRLLVEQTWLDTPLSLIHPSADIALYPDGGTSRIVEISLQWPAETENLAEQSADTEQKAQELLEQVDLSPEELTPENLLAALRNVADVESGGMTAYSVLVEGRGNALGFARAMRLLCLLTDLEATVAEGSKDDLITYWLIVNTPEGYRHLDPTQPQPSYATDEDFLNAGYLWNTERYPACTDHTTPAEPDPEGGEEGEEGEEGPQEGEDGEEAPQQGENG